MTSLKSHLEETKPNQESLRVIQQKRDRGNTFGHESKDPCKAVCSNSLISIDDYKFIQINFKKEKTASLYCVDLRHGDSTINCKPYFDNYTQCQKFWVFISFYFILIKYHKDFLNFVLYQNKVCCSRIPLQISNEKEARSATGQ